MSTMDNAEVLLAKAKFHQENITKVEQLWGSDSDLVALAKEQFEHYFNLASEAYNQALGEVFERVDRAVQTLH
jgi:hypothetical protein